MSFSKKNSFRLSNLDRKMGKQHQKTPSPQGRVKPPHKSGHKKDAGRVIPEWLTWSAAVAVLPVIFGVFGWYIFITYTFTLSLTSLAYPPFILTLTLDGFTHTLNPWCNVSMWVAHLGPWSAAVAVLPVLFLYKYIFVQKICLAPVEQIIRLLRSFFSVK